MFENPVAPVRGPSSGWFGRVDSVIKARATRGNGLSAVAPGLQEESRLGSPEGDRLEGEGRTYPRGGYSTAPRQTGDRIPLNAGECANYFRRPRKLDLDDSRRGGQPGWWRACAEPSTSRTGSAARPVPDSTPNGVDRGKSGRCGYHRRCSRLAGSRGRCRISRRRGGRSGIDRISRFRRR